MRKSLNKKKSLFPMPILVIGTYNEDGSADFMTAAWGTLEDSLVVEIELTADHKTSENLLRDKVFSVAFADSKHVKEADYFGLVSNHDCQDKVAKAKIHVVKGEVLNVPVMDELPYVMECSLLRVDTTDGDFRVYGKIENVSVRDDLLDEEGNLLVDRLDPAIYWSVDHTYHKMGETVGHAFKDGNELK